MFRTALISICIICSATSAKTPLYEDFKLLASDGASEDIFGISVSISGDGTTAIVGAYYDDDNGTYSGSAMIQLECLKTGQRYRPHTRAHLPI